MKKLLAVLIAFAICGYANAQMVLNDLIGNDPEKEKLCAARAKEKMVPFVIDSEYVKRSRALNPDATFIATDGTSPQLIECYRSEGTGKFQPVSMSPEQNYWHLVKPESFAPGLRTDVGIKMVRQACKEVFLEKVSRPNLQRAVVGLSAQEIDKTKTIYWEKRKRKQIGGKQLVRYDIFIDGTASYEIGSVDLKVIPFACVFTPMLKLKAFQFDSH